MTDWGLVYAEAKVVATVRFVGRRGWFAVVWRAWLAAMRENMVVSKLFTRGDFAPPLRYLNWRVLADGAGASLGREGY